MTQNAPTLTPQSSPDEIKHFLRENFKNLPEKDLKKMKELQEILKKYPSKGTSLADELIEERRKEGK